MITKFMVHLKYILPAAAALLVSLTLTAETPSWIRKNAISPDGKTLAFSYKGDIYTVPVTGGEARQLTSNPAYESDPVWTRDSHQIVFTSTREESKDLYVTSVEGGVPHRLTTLPGNELPLAVTADGRVWFSWYDNTVSSTASATFRATGRSGRRTFKEERPSFSPPSPSPP